MKQLLMIGILGTSLVIPAQASEQEKHEMSMSESCPMHEPHQATTSAHEHQMPDLKIRGQQGMGFSQQTTTHHFLLQRNGGTIQVTANSSDDSAAIEEIRAHLKHIAAAFRSGDFDIPMFVHNQTPPGVPVMEKLKQHIRYKYSSVENGGQVHITTHEAEAIAAIHEFLKFQITEHKTGDPLN